MSTMALKSAAPAASKAARTHPRRAALLEAAPWLSANTLAPRASGVKKASAWMLTNRSACTRRAFCSVVFMTATLRVLATIGP